MATSKATMGPASFAADQYRYSVLLELDDSDSSAAPSRCGSALSYCSYDERIDKLNAQSSSESNPSNVDDKENNLEDSIINRIRDLDIGTQKELLDRQARPRANTFRVPDTAYQPSVSESESKSQQGYSDTSSELDYIESFEQARPASPSLLLGLNPHLRDIFNPQDLPTPSTDIHRQFERHNSGQYQAILLVPVHDKNHLISDIARDETLLFRYSTEDQVYSLAYGINLVKKADPEDNEPGNGTHKGLNSQGKRDGMANIITLLAHRLTKHDQVLKRHPHLVHKIQTGQTAPYPYSQVFPVPDNDQPPSYAEAVPSSVRGPIEYPRRQCHECAHHSQETTSTRTAVRSSKMESPMDSHARIEDSVEALDRLEEEIEAASVQFAPSESPTRPSLRSMLPVTPEAKHRSRLVEPKIRRTPTAQIRDSNTEKYKTISGRSKAITTVKQELRRSSSMSMRESRESTGISEDDRLNRRRSVAGPINSLLPPKSKQRPSKPVTQVMEFELPGVAVSRRLKEQREARIAAQKEREAMAAQQVSPVARSGSRALASGSQTVRRVKSQKRLTIPNFELPSESTSRRRKQDLAERVRQQEEEERRAREFKARPMPANIYGGSPQFQRSPLASSSPLRMRQSINSESNDEKQEKRGSLRVNPKRVTIGPAQIQANIRSGTPSDGSSRASGGVDSAASNRDSDHRPGSVCPHGCRVSVSMEDLNMQRVRGKEILAQDSGRVRILEQERKRREAIAKVARQEAAERSRQASREWAEKQRRRQSVARVSGA